VGALTYEYPVPAFTALYNAARHYERTTLARDAGRLLDRALATVIVNGRFTATNAELEALGVGPVAVETVERGAP